MVIIIIALVIVIVVINKKRKKAEEQYQEMLMLQNTQYINQQATPPLPPASITVTTAESKVDSEPVSQETSSQELLTVNEEHPKDSNEKRYDETFDITPTNKCLWDDFVAIDFETMSRMQTSACAIGMVKVVDGVIVQRFYSLICPVEDGYVQNDPLIGIHGIYYKDAIKAPTFDVLFPLIRDFIGDFNVVAHNATFDYGVLCALLSHYNLKWGCLDTDVICTYKATGLSLVKACEEYGIELTSHHDALADAEACAKVYLAYKGKTIINVAYGGKKKASQKTSNKLKAAQINELVSNTTVSDEDNIFYGKNIIITGTITGYDRVTLAEKLISMGATIKTSMSKKVDILIAGDECGPAKIKKAQEMQDDGHHIIIMSERDLFKNLDIEVVVDDVDLD